MEPATLILHIRYSRWATGRVLDAVRTVPPEDLSKDLGSSYGSILGTLHHIYQGDRIWFARLQGQPTGKLSEFEPPAGFAAFEKEWLGLGDRLVAWSEGLPLERWTEVIAYRDTTGTPFQTPARQIVLHLVNHATYHRGQVTTLLRQLGHPVVGTDLIAYYRSLEK